MKKKEMTKVLIADSSPFVCIMLTTALEKLGFEVVGRAKNGKEAIDKYMKLKPDIILIDAALNDVEGIQVTRVITSENASIIILMVAESADTPDTIVEAVKAGIAGYLRKPFSAEEIEARMSALKKR